MSDSVMTSDAWDIQHVTEHNVLWVRSLQANGLDAKAVKDEIGKWTMDGVTQLARRASWARCWQSRRQGPPHFGHQG
jgi:hypothetical protein